MTRSTILPQLELTRNQHAAVRLDSRVPFIELIEADSPAIDERLTSISFLKDREFGTLWSYARLERVSNADATEQKSCEHT